MPKFEPVPSVGFFLFGLVKLLLSHYSFVQSLLQSVRQENSKLGVEVFADLSSTLESAVKITNM